jgi:hypothetical protein
MENRENLAKIALPPLLSLSPLYPPLVIIQKV